MTKEEAIKILYEMEYKTAYSGELGGLAVEMAVEALRNQPSLPSNLDEAAEEYCINNDPTNQRCGNCIIQVFKAGAEWMAKRGFISEGIVNQTSGEDTFIELNEHIGYLEDCEEVIVNIRKK